MNKWLNDGSRMNREVHVRFCEGLGVQFLRPTHLYVAVSRGRENNTIYCDKSSLREMPFEKRVALKGKSAEVKRQAFSEHFIGEVAAIVGTSHQKDSTQNYLSPDREKVKSLLKRFQDKNWLGASVTKINQAYTAQFHELKQSIKTTISKIKSLNNKERRAEKSKTQDNEKSR